MGAMLVAPFIAQTPGIIIGLTKILGLQESFLRLVVSMFFPGFWWEVTTNVRSAYDPMWPVVDQQATAFSGLSAQLKMVGSGLGFWGTKSRPVKLYFFDESQTIRALEIVESNANKA